MEVGFLLVGAAVGLGLGAFLFFYRKPKVKIGQKPDSETGVAEPEKPVWQRIQLGFSGKLNDLLSSAKKFDNSFYSDLEELLYTSDLGPKSVEQLLAAVKNKLSRSEMGDLGQVKGALSEEILKILNESSTGPLFSDQGKPWVILVVGVNGVGKTTSIGKLSHYYSNLGKSVLIVAGDTFRAAAQEQLGVWGQRAGVQVYISQQSKDPSAVAFEGVQKALKENIQVVIVDTAGRLHNKENLMEELKKTKRVIGKVIPDGPHETVLVVDGNSGQNALAQAKQFNEALGLTSLVVSKLDGTAKGGVIVGIARDLGLGVQFIGVGEKLSDLEKFSPELFTKSLLDLN